MSQQGPIIVVSTAERPSFAAALDEARMFPVIDTDWADASRAVEQLQPAAVLVAMPEAAEPGFEALAKQIAARQPYLPLIAVDPTTSLPENAIPFSQTDGNFDRLIGAPARGAAGPDLACHRDAPARRRSGGAQRRWPTSIPPATPPCC